MKVCFRCLQAKNLSDFYKHPSTADGHLNKCKECTKADAQRYRMENLERVRAYDRARGSRPERVAARKEYSQTLEGRLAHARANEKWQVANAVRRRASHLVAKAIRTGKLTPEPCFICGEKAHAHHPDYSRPLSVTWLFPEHHKAAHRIVAELRYAAGEVDTLRF